MAMHIHCLAFSVRRRDRCREEQTCYGWPGVTKKQQATPTCVQIMTVGGYPGLLAGSKPHTFFKELTALYQKWMWRGGKGYLALSAHRQIFVLPAMVGSDMVLGTKQDPNQVFTDLCSNIRSGLPGSLTHLLSLYLCLPHRKPCSHWFDSWYDTNSESSVASPQDSLACGLVESPLWIDFKDRLQSALPFFLWEQKQRACSL